MEAREVGRRVRAARAYAALNASELGRAVGLSRSTLLRIEYGQRTARPGEIEAIARHCRVGLAFFEEGSECFNDKAPAPG